MSESWREDFWFCWTKEIVEERYLKDFHEGEFKLQ